MFMKGTAKLTIAEQPVSNVEEQVRCRAYELYEQRGKADGYDLQDWLLAESEIKGTELGTTAA
jgi:Protein of unknown function (DUF2934)